jgi:NitT/TauT family transport system substrate-binding protein
MKGKNHQRFRQVMGLALLALLCAGCGGKTGAEKKTEDGQGIEKIRLGVMSGSVTAYAADIGLAEGIFEKHGLQVETASFAAGINTIDAVTLGQMDIGFGADFAVINRLGGSADSPLRIFAGLGEGTPSAYQLYARGDSIKTPADLRGKNILVSLGTVTEYWTAKALGAGGLSEADVKILPIDSAMEGVALIQDGTAQAMWAAAQAGEALRKTEGVHRIADISIAGAPTVNVAVATEQFLRDRPGAALKYLQALQEIYDFIAQNPQRAAEIVRKESGSPAAITLINLENNVNYIRFDQRFFDSLDSIRQWVSEKGMIKYPYDLHRYVDVRALEAAFPGRAEFK